MMPREPLAPTCGVIGAELNLARSSLLSLTFMTKWPRVHVPGYRSRSPVLLVWSIGHLSSVFLLLTFTVASTVSGTGMSPEISALER
jgi:hypothetical protein